MLVLMTCLRIHVLMVGLWCFKGTISASRGAAVPSRHRRASSPGEEVVGGIFFDFEAGVDGSATGEPVTGPSPRAKLTGPQSRSFGRGASPSHLSFRPPMAKAVGVARRRQQLF